MAVLIVSAPGLLYVAGISNVEGRPTPDAAPPLRSAQRQWLRCELWADGQDQAPITNPWQAALKFIEQDSLRSYSGELAWIVARNYNTTHLRQREMSYWHLSGVSLTIWVARHWTQDQMESQLHALLQDASRFRCQPGPSEWQP